MIDEKKLIEWAELVRDDYIKIFGDFHSAGVVQYIIDGIKEQPKIGEWIPCSERMPPEHNSIFANLKRTHKWCVGMFEKRSDEVNVTVEFTDGTRMTKTSHTEDGKWKVDRYPECEVIAWMEKPEPYKESED